MRTLKYIFVLLFYNICLFFWHLDMAGIFWFTFIFSPMNYQMKWKDSIYIVYEHFVVKGRFIVIINSKMRRCLGVFTVCTCTMDWCLWQITCHFDVVYLMMYMIVFERMEITFHRSNDMRLSYFLTIALFRWSFRRTQRQPAPDGLLMKYLYFFY